MSPEEAIIISVTIATVIGGFWTFIGHYLGSRELRKGFAEMGKQMREGFGKMDERFSKMDERFEALLKESSEAHTKILEAIREASKRRRKKSSSL